MKKNVRFLGMDVHAETIAVAIAEPDGAVRSLGTIANRAESIGKLVKKLGAVEHLKACYEAGPTGYVLYWQLAELGVACEVIAPTLVPMKAGDRVKTDRRDAERLARSYRSGDLTAVWVPDEGSEALRDLVRAREAAKQDQLRARHRLSKLTEMLSQRIYGLALGYEDLNDHEQLRRDPLLGLLAGKQELNEPLAGKSTLNRLELTGRSLRYHKIAYSAEAIDRLLTDLFVESQAAAPGQVVLDLDATDIPLYGHQPERFFHGHYDSYCYLPLYIFAGDQLLCARLRPANQDAASGSVEEVRRIVAQLRERWPQVRIVLRADSGFCREQLMGWCEHNHVDYVFGLARNQRLSKIVGAQMQQARALHQSTGKAARVFAEFDSRTHKSWSCARRVAAKAEYLDKGENPRFVVTSLTPQQWAAQDLYEKFYCARGEMENRIKEQMCLSADRLSTHEMKGNQLRLYFSALAYTLMEALRRLALKGTAWAQAKSIPSA